MRFHKKRLLFFLFSLFTALLFYYVLTKITPNTDLSVGSFQVSSSIVFFLAVFVFAASLFSTLFANIRRGIFCGLLLIGILLLRLYHLANGLFVLLLFCAFLALELAFYQRKKSKLRRLHERDLS